MKQKILLDTGPLVASINKKDCFFEWAINHFENFKPPLLTCEPVLAESCFLLRKYPEGAVIIMELLNRKILEVPFQIESQVKSISGLLRKYSNVPMSLADACLVRMSELFDHSTIMTTDTDFTIYRRHGRQIIPLLIPPDIW